jgi:hypothetical protein
MMQILKLQILIIIKKINRNEASFHVGPSFHLRNMDPVLGCTMLTVHQHSLPHPSSALLLVYIYLGAQINPTGPLPTHFLPSENDSFRAFFHGQTLFLQFPGPEDFFVLTSHASLHYSTTPHPMLMLPSLQVALINKIK